MKGKQSSFRRMSLAVFLALLIAFGYLQMQFAVFSVKSFDWLAFLDHDTIYQAAHFAAIDLGMDHVSLMNTSLIDYGSELKWLALAFSFLSEWCGFFQYNELNAYYFLASVHILCTVLAFAIGGICLIWRDKPIEALLWLLILITSPSVAIYSGFVKPEPNVVLLSVFLGLLALEKYRAQHKMAWLALALFCAALGTTTKWFGFFLLFPIWITELENRSELVRSPRRQLWIGFLLPLLSLWTLLTVVSFGLTYLVEALMSGTPFPILAIRIPFSDSLTFFGLFSAVFSRQVAFACLLVSLIIAALLYVIHRKLCNESRLSARACRAVLTIVPLFAIALLILYLPLAFHPEQLQASILHFGQYNMVASGAHGRGDQELGALSLLQNGWSWLRAAWRDGLLSIPIVILLAWATMVRIRRSFRMDPVVRDAGSYIVALCLPLFLFITKLMDATLVMVFSLFLFFLIGAFVRQSATDRFSLAGFIKYGVIIAICIGQIAVQNQGRLPSIFEVYKNRSQLESRVAQVQEVIERTVPAGAIVLMCERDIPLSGGLELRRLPASECLLRDPVPALKPGEWLLLTDEQRKRARTIAPSSDPNLAASLSIPRSNRDGFWDTEQMYVYRIP